MSNIKPILERVERRRHDLATLRVEPGGFDRDQQALAACVRDLAEKVQKVAREPGYLARLDMAAAVLAKYGLEGDR